MTASPLHIWRCPRCKVGVKAPKRPPGDDLRRLCMRCTRKHKRLVYRVLVIRETRKKQAAAREKERRKKAKAARVPSPRKLPGMAPAELEKLFDIELERPAKGTRR